MYDQNYYNCSGNTLNRLAIWDEKNGGKPIFSVTHMGLHIHLFPEIAFYIKGKAVLAISQDWEKGVK